MTSSQSSPLVIHHKSKKIKKTKNKNSLKNTKKDVSRSYQTVGDSMKKYILLELKKRLLILCNVKFDEEKEWNEEQYFQLLNSVNLEDYNNLLKEILSNYV